MPDLICTNCAEPWEMDFVLYEEPEEFKRIGGMITHCPCCPPKVFRTQPDGSILLTARPENLSPEDKTRIEVAKTLGLVLRSDIDAYVSMLQEAL